MKKNMKKNMKIISIGCTLILFLSGCNPLFSDGEAKKLERTYEKPQTLQVDINLLNIENKLLAREVPIEPGSRDPLNDISDAFVDGKLDVRYYDISHLNLADLSEEQLQTISFDDDIIWPKELPSNFNPKEIMELGKDPGLGVRDLHKQGLTGKGVNIGIIDQGLYQDHIEYRDRLKLYEEYQSMYAYAEMHGSGVSSIALGKTTGVAPDADLYYIASTAWTDDYDLTPIAESIYRFIEINKALQGDNKIRVISISYGYVPDTKGAKEMEEAIDSAKKEGIFVICANTAMHGFDLLGSGGFMTSDPNDLTSRRPALEWRKHYSEQADAYQSSNLLIVPQDNRTYASAFSDSTKSYEFAADGGISWTVPWIAGFYALCLEANPDISIDEFVNTCLETGDTIEFTQDGKGYTFGKIINPKKVVEILSK